MIFDEFSNFFMNIDEISTSRIDCETNFLSMLENFFQSGCIFAGKSISSI